MKLGWKHIVAFSFSLLWLACSSGPPPASDTAPAETDSQTDPGNATDPGPPPDPGSPSDPGSATDPTSSPDGLPLPDPGSSSDLGDADQESGPSCPGDVNCPCSANSDCNSGFCVPSGDGLICAQVCVDDCPDGFSCALLELPGQDATYVCLSRSTNLCRPCNYHSECRDNGGDPEARCVLFDAYEGSFCGLSCSDEIPCPGGYSCDSRVDPDTNETYEQCMPESGACTCNEKARIDGASTDCANLECTGTRFCTMEGLTVCDSQEPEDEICDDVDNNCNGEKDEDFLTGGFYVHPEHCGSCGQSCLEEFANATGTCGLVNGLPACVIESCNAGFEQASETECTASLDPPCGTDEAQCDPGDSEELSCGNCGQKSRSCAGNCVWIDWSECGDEGPCAVGASEDENQSCGNCGNQSRYRTCDDTCAWNDWNEWTACADEGSCSPDTDEDQSCGNCGTQIRTCNTECNWGEWSDCGEEGACAPDTTETENEPCGDCGSRDRSRACSATCEWNEWGEWSECSEEAICSPDQVEEQSQSMPCGNCGSQAQTRSRSCSETCGWGEWGEWVDVGECSDEGVCAIGGSEDESQSCGSCGNQSRYRTCNENCAWNEWNEWTACADEGVCAPDAEQDQACGNCGTQIRICNAECGWGEWGDCSGEGVCIPETPELESGACGNCGARDRNRTCTPICEWSDWGEWETCGGEGICAVDQVESQSQDISCGDCGSQTQTRSRNCTAACEWAEWSEWSNVGGCSAEAICSPDQIEEQPQNIPCGNCGSQAQTRSRSCTATCGWGEWGEWSDVGECSDEGACAIGESEDESQQCGSCGNQSRYRTCDENCVWNEWNEWTACADGGICAPDAEQDQACGNCGTQIRICNAECGWGEWGDCSGAGVCIPETPEVETGACGNCGARDRSRTCTPICEWSDWGEWETCGDEGICAADQLESQDQDISCGNCGTQAQTRGRSCTAACEWAAWGEWGSVGECSDEGACAVDQAESQDQDIACGNCGSQAQTRSRSCTAACEWAAWGGWDNVGVCTDEGACAADQAESQDQDISCGDCGTQAQTRSRSCTGTCEWAAWDDWGNVGGCSDEGACAVDQTESQDQDITCGNCGTPSQTRGRSCTAACEWAAWGEWGSVGGCAGEGACGVGQNQSESQDISCGNCGSQAQTRSRSCTAACEWPAWSEWSNVGGCNGEGVCAADQAESQDQDITCGNCGTQAQTRSRSCSATCGWDAWGGWSDVGGCTDEGACGVGQNQSESQDITCGNCGSQAQTRSRSCTAACGWPAWGGWSNVGGCNGEGVCAADQAESDSRDISCGNCGTQAQTRSRSCTATCGWDAWGAWSNVGGCSGSGECADGASQSQDQDITCGNCGSQAQTRSRSCSGSCSWPAWGGWSNVGGCTDEGACGVGQNDTDSRDISCGNCGTQAQTRSRGCTAECGWAAWGGWSNVGGCSGSGECSSGSSQSQDQGVDCGNCGSQDQTRSRSCSGSCSWGGWGGWSNVGGCSGSGECAVSTSQSQNQDVDCGNCGSQEQTRSRSCSGSCSWGGWGGWSNVGGCSGSGVCYGGQTQSESRSCEGCGTQTRTQTCGFWCAWMGWSDWSACNNPYPDCCPWEIDYDCFTLSCPFFENMWRQCNGNGTWGPCLCGEIP